MGNRLHVLWDDGERVFCRDKLPGEGGGHAVLLARPAAEHPLPATLDRLAHEFALRDELDGAWAVRPLELSRDGGRTVLVLDGSGRRAARRRCWARRWMPAPSCATRSASPWRSASCTSAAWSTRTSSPAHILVNCADGQARLTGFGLASRLPRERQAPEPPETIAGTLAYMAPEQTGRMNRSIDSRSDLYALGVTLYQMLTGALPFTATDADGVGALPHRPDAAAAARCGWRPCRPRCPHRHEAAGQDAPRSATRPPPGSSTTCGAAWTSWERQRRIEDFPLGEHGTRDRLLIPEKLYGREQRGRHPARRLRARRPHGSTPELVLVSGYSGIGKSSVVNELHRVLVPPRGLFASGKFDQYKRDIPYATLVQAFQSLVRTLLGKRDAELARWRDALLEALEPNARLMTDLIPELKLIIGEPPPVPELEPQQAQHRFLLVFRRFIGVFARPEHPLALFLDDLQWLDAATLDLLEDVLTRADLRHLMLVGAYRDNEVDATHPLTGKLLAIRNAGVRIEDITLAPLGRAHIEQLLADVAALRTGAHRAAGAAGARQDGRQSVLRDPVPAGAGGGGPAGLRPRRAAAGPGTPTASTPRATPTTSWT